MSGSCVAEVAQVRSEYTSARLICSNLKHRLAGTRYVRYPGYIPPETDVVLEDRAVETLAVRDADVRFLDRVPPPTALEHVGFIHRARRGDLRAAAELDRRMRDTYGKIAGRFTSQTLAENEFVLPYTTARPFAEQAASHKGAILLDLSQRGFATADFNILTAHSYQLPAQELEQCVRDSVRNLEVLSGRRLGDPHNPLLVAVRSALPEHMPGFMPTYLNAELTPAVLLGLPGRYGIEAAVRIRLNNRKTLLEALDPEALSGMEAEIQPGLPLERNEEIALRLEEHIARHDSRILEDAFTQVLFFVKQAYAYYDDHLGVLRNFMLREVQYPAVILQRMVCSVIDDQSYAGVLYSRHPQQGRGVFLQFARAIYGEDLMTGRLLPEERHFLARDEARHDFPAVYHFWNRLTQLEDLFHGPVMVEFTGVHGTFTILQVNAGELSGAGMLTAVMEMHRSGSISAERVRELIKSHHIRQIESDAIDPRSLHALVPFARGVAVLPRSDVTGKLYFSVARAEQALEEQGGYHVILAKARFTPQDVIDMQKVSGICSLSPAAIHVVTTAQNLGIPALLNLEESGLRIDAEARRLLGRNAAEIGEGDWVTISSRYATLYAGQAVYAPARLLRLMAGEAVDIDPADRPRFERLAADYRQYRRILEAVDATHFASLQDLGHAIRYGELRDDHERAVEIVNRCFDLRAEGLALRLLETTLGMHLINGTAFSCLTPDRRARLLRAAASRCLQHGLSGYQVGAFVVGSLIDPESPASFWERFEPGEIAFLLNEWVLYQKYLRVLDEVGESRISRARNYIHTQGLNALCIPKSKATGFLTLKLSGIDLNEVRRRLPAGVDPRTVELIEVLQRPFGTLFDYANPSNLEHLRRACAQEGVPLPDPKDSYTERLK
ncbi:MAG: hypothetical protein ABSH28_16840 [Acidobacteriota bacterium]